MSDLGRLFRLSGLGQEPLENFTTEALAIAIGHDHRPMAHALSATQWTCPARGQNELPPPRIVPGEITSITASTQVPVWPGKEGWLNMGYLDLVLRVGGEHPSLPPELWVEVKVDAWESGNQLQNYERHAAERTPPPTVITLGRTRLSHSFPCLQWTDIEWGIDAVAASGQPPHHSWISLREFLKDEGIVRPALPGSALDDPEAIVEVIVDVNGLLRRHWPGTSIVWQDGKLRSALNKVIAASGGGEGTSTLVHELVAVGGPLLYGAVIDGGQWNWGLGVSTRNYQRVKLDATQMRMDADLGGLPPEWNRRVGSRTVLERHRAFQAKENPHDIVDWFEEGLHQLIRAKVLDRFFAGLAVSGTTPELTDPPSHVSGGILEAHHIDLSKAYDRPTLELFDEVSAELADAYHPLFTKVGALKAGDLKLWSGKRLLTSTRSNLAAKRCTHHGVSRVETADD